MYGPNEFTMNIILGTAPGESVKKEHRRPGRAGGGHRVSMCAERDVDGSNDASLTHSLTRGQSVSAAPALLGRLLCVSMWRGGTHLLGDDVAGRSNARALLHRHGGSGHESHHLGREQAERHGKMRLRTTEDKERKGPPGLA